MPVRMAPTWLPMAASPVRAGFPSPAQDFMAQRIDLARELLPHPHCTFILRLTGDSMEGVGMFDGDLLVVDKSLQAGHNDIVVAEVDGEFTCKRLVQQRGQLALHAENPAYPDILQADCETMTVWGVVTCCIKRFRC